ncbi:hypothetical protein V5J35_004106 [Endozoicomonas sp. NE40]|uniref:Uncharacterized protein n=1 Tax=Endozoicomonas lisbonensis TaxID=3120522 RepID=A0ABV2SNI9_9GAMM
MSKDYVEMYSRLEIIYINKAGNKDPGDQNARLD